MNNQIKVLRFAIIFLVVVLLAWMLVSMPASRAIVSFATLAVVAAAVVALGPRIRQWIQHPIVAAITANGAAASLAGQIPQPSAEDVIPSPAAQPVQPTADSFSLVQGRGRLLLVFIGFLIFIYALQFSIYRDPTDWPIDGALVLMGLSVAGVAYLFSRMSISKSTEATNPLVVAQTTGGFQIRWRWLAVSAGLAYLTAVRGSQTPENAYFGELLFIWSLSILAFLYAIASKAAPQAATVDNKIFQKWEYLLLVGLFVFALIPRIFNLGSQPVVFDTDEAVFSLEGAEMSASHLLITPFNQSNYFQSRLYPLFIAVLMQFTGPTVEAARLPVALAGALLVPAAYLLGCEIYNRYLGLIAALFLVGWAFAVQFSRIAIGETFDPLFLTLCFYFFLRALRRGRSLDYALAGIMLGLAQYFWISGLLGIPIIAAFLLFLFIRTPKSVMKQWRYLLLVVAGFVVTTFPLYYYLNLHQLPLSTRAYLTNQFFQTLQDTLRAGDFSFLSNQIRISFMALISTHDTTLFYGTTSNIMSPIGGPLLILGAVITLFMMWKYPKWSLPLGWSLTVVIGGGTLVPYGPSYHHYAVGAPPFALLASVGVLAIVWMLGWTLQRPRLVGNLSIALGVVVCVANLIFYADVFVPEKQYFQRENNWVNTRIGSEASAAIKSGHQVVLSGGWQMTVNDGLVVQFLTFGGKYKISDQPTDPNLLALVDPTQPFEYIIALQKKDQLDLLQKTYPDGKALEVSLDLDHSPIFYTFTRG